MRYDVQFTNQFKKDLKLAQKQKKNLDKLFDVIDILANGGILDVKYKDHELTGNYKGTRECHVEPECRKKESALTYFWVDADFFDGRKRVEKEKRV